MNYKKWIVIIVGIFEAIQITGCANNRYTIKINDCNIETVLEVTDQKTVAEAIDEAEIVINKKDKVEPKLEERITTDTVININRNANVTVVADGKNHSLNMTGGTVGDALKESGIVLSKKDIMNHDINAYLTDGMDIQVVRRISVIFSADGKTEEIFTDAKTVKEFLEQQSISVGKDDRLSMNRKAKLKDGCKLTLKRVTFKEETVREEIPFSTTTQNDKSMKKGTKKIIKQGVNGECDVLYKVTYVDGKEESREKLSSKTIKEPVNRIMKVGTKSGKQIKRKWKEVECDGTIIWHIEYTDGTKKVYYK